MRPRTPERQWCDRNDLTMDQARRLGGYLRLVELQNNRPEIYRIVVTDIKKIRKRMRVAA